ncbi:hypothetical protein OC834_005735 [Tilletia horrida]|nr:hypothetical protein OC834_005735 [Tilletia horrida]
MSFRTPRTIPLREQQRAAAAARRAARESRYEQAREEQEERMALREAQLRFSPFAKTEWGKLSLSPDQATSLSVLYGDGCQLGTVHYDVDSEADQARATSKLAGIHFLHGPQESKQQRFSIAWSWKSAKEEWTRILYQCQCGYFDAARRARDRGKAALPRLLKPFNDSESRPIEIARFVAYPFTPVSLLHSPLTSLFCSAFARLAWGPGPLGGMGQSASSG